MPRDLRICFIGDSFITGTRDATFLGWTGRVCAHWQRAEVGLTGYNLGIRRDTSRDILGRWQREARVRLPPACAGRLVFSFGVNDCLLEAGQVRVPASETRANAQLILDAAAAWLPTVLVGPPPVTLPGQGEINQRIGSISHALQELCAERRVPFIELFGPLHADPAWVADLQGDGAHPTAVGYARMAALVLADPAWRAWTTSHPLA